MSVKKLLILAAAGVVSTSALAGGASNYSAPASMSSEDQVGLYVGVNAGWANTMWKNQVGTASGASWNDNNGFVGGVDVGYSFNENLALELGGLWLSKVKYNNSGTSSLKTWDMYLAGKGTVDLYEDLNAFGKFGVAYNHSNIGTGATLPSTLTTTGNHNSWEPLFAVGLGYDFAQDWNVNAQYMYIMGKESNDVSTTAAQNIFTLGLAYTFAM